MAARNEYRLKKLTKAAIFVQVIHIKTCITWKSTFLLFSDVKNEYSLLEKIAGKMALS